MGNNNLDLGALDLLKEEMSSDETFVKVNCIHRLKTISTVLGSELVKQQLIPYLSSNIYISLITRRRRSSVCLGRIAQRPLFLRPHQSCEFIRNIRKLSRVR